ncbi:MAG: hypothetical protein Q9182_005469 [Xanthomendoza sp. 2 TL-2023]
MDAMDDLPLAVRRKRRASSALVDLADKEASCQTNEKQSTQNASSEPPKTPGHRKKKTRFSDSVLEIRESSSSTGVASSTGLTPALNRTFLVSGKSINKVKKRLSLPSQLTTSFASRTSTGVSQSAGPLQIQFEPLREVIDARTMRQLKRSHLSETTNEIYAEKKSRNALQQEIENLRNELASARQQEHSEFDGASNSTEMGNGETARIAELENELAELKQEMREQSIAIDPAISEALNDRSSISSPMPIEVDDSDGLGPYQDHVNDLTGDDSQPDRSNAPLGNFNVEAFTQTSPSSPTWLEGLRSARLEYERLFPGETTIGLEISDPAPFVQTMIARAESLKKTNDRLDQHIAVSETSQTNMKNNFDSALRQLERHSNLIKAMKLELNEVKGSARTAELEISTLEARVENAESKCSIAKKQRDDNQRSVERLQGAIDHYREEAGKLTQTVFKLECDHKEAYAKLRRELESSNGVALAARDAFFDGTISDLEAQVAAETNGRRKAEESAVERGDRIKQLEHRQAELQRAVHEKQEIIRQLETEIQQNKSGHANEVGQLNVRIGELSSNISATNTELSKVRQESSRLAGLVEQEKAAGIQAVQSMQSEVKQCADKVDAAKDKHAEGVKKRGEEVTQSFGLITPVVEGGRFRDAEADEKVEGHIELTRGKGARRRPDSGVGLWATSIEEELEDVDILMDDV